MCAVCTALSQVHMKMISIGILCLLSRDTIPMQNTVAYISQVNSAGIKKLLIHDVSADPYLSSETVLEEVIGSSASVGSRPTSTLQGTFRCFRCLQKISNEAFYHHMQKHQIQPRIQYKCVVSRCNYRYATLAAIQLHYLAQHSI